MIMKNAIASGLLALAVLSGTLAPASAAGSDYRDSNGRPICTHGDC
jgi:hypothetical protein